MRQRLGILVTTCLVTGLVACSGVSAESPQGEIQPNITQVRSADGMLMVLVPAGEFRMGRRMSKDGPVHSVTLDSYWIDQTEVTNAHYRQCVEAGDCRAPTTCSWGEPTYNHPTMDDHPVVCVTWQDAANYCAWAGGRLPTEAEWEYAARGPEALTYPWGDQFDGTLLNFCDVDCPHEDQRDVDYDDRYARTAPAGSYPDGASWCGTLDMSGNVWEWVADWFGPYPSIAQTNPTGPTSGSERILRGGSWYENVEYDFLRAGFRHEYEPEATHDLVGFRCVMSSGE